MRAGLAAAGYGVVWRRPLHQAANPQGFAVATGALLSVERARRLVCIDPATGTARWEHRVSDTWGPLSTTAAECCYLDERLAVLRCLELGTGVQRWTRRLARPGGYAVSAGAIVLTGGWLHHEPLTGFDLATGGARWSFSFAHRSGPTVCLRPLVLADRLLIGSPGDRLLWALDTASGQVRRRWRLPQPLSDADARPAFAAVGDRAALVRCGDRLVVRIDLDRSATRTVWWHDADLETDAVTPLGAQLLLRERSGRTVVVEPDRAAVRWSRRLPEPAVTDAVARPGGYAVADRSGLLWLLDEQGEVTGQAAVSRRNHLLAGGPGGRLFLLGKGELICVAPTGPTDRSALPASAAPGIAAAPEAPGNC